MILMIDNYDSFVYNLYQLAGSIHPEIEVRRNDALSLEEIEKMNPEAIILSPGPGRPSQAGICIQAVRYFTGKIPILGVCLGHQAICEAFGGRIVYAKELMHGKTSKIQTDTSSSLFKGIENPVTVARYHSLAADPETLPGELRVTAKTLEGEIMAVEHVEYPVYGIQFHPESVMTLMGRKILENFFQTQRKTEIDKV